jgi:catechol 2,3-dioxygenase-like lactoylglutathione lyase family enzyme
MQQNDRERTRPSIGLLVRNVASSRAFYTDLLGFGTANMSLPDTLAQVIDFDNDHLLLIGPDAGDVAAYLNEPQIILEPGTTIGFFCQDLDAKLAEWRARGLTEVQETKTPLDDRALLVKDPDGNVLRFSEPRQRSPEEIIELYAQGPQRLQKALAGISEQYLELSKAPGEWTIRQLVHHIADGDDLWMSAVKAALVSSGTQYRHDWYTPDNASADILDYAGRAIKPALLLFRANHEHILQLVRHLPGALERYVMFEWPGQEARQFTVQGILYSQAMHVAIHCNEITEIRSLQRS